VTTPPTSVATPTSRALRAVRNRERLLTELREYGARGGRIQPHRAMIGGELTLARGLEIFVLPVLLAAGVVALMPFIATLWTFLFERLREPLGLPGTIGRDVISFGGLMSIAFPYPTATVAVPDSFQWTVVGLFTAALLLISILLPGRWLPLTYALRFAAVVQGTALVVFAIPGAHFPYSLPMYALGFLRMGAVMLVLVPVVLGLVYFPFDVPLWRKLLVVALIVGHAVVLIPLQTLLHVALSWRLSALVMPTMFFVFGVLVEIFAFVAFYGWAMSWSERAAPPPRQLSLTPQSIPTVPHA
jgi:hypothetical protein